MGFGVGCYANCCVGNTYRVRSIRHLAYSLFTPPWDVSSNLSWNYYDNGRGPDAPGPCSEPNGWRQTTALTSTTYNDGNGANELIVGASQIFRYPPATVHDGPTGGIFVGSSPTMLSDWFACRQISGHSGYGAGGLEQYIGSIGEPGDMSGVSTSMLTAAWLFMAPVTEGQSIKSQWLYERFRFFITLNQKRFGSLADLPQRIIELAQYNPMTQLWDILQDSPVDITGFDIVVGSAGGRLGNRGDELQDDDTGIVHDVTGALYWVTKHLLIGDFQLVASVSSPPRDASVVEYELTTGFDLTTPITNSFERERAIPFGAVWWMAIIPRATGMCFEDNKIPPEPLAIPSDQYYGDAWFTQQWASYGGAPGGLPDMASLNVVRVVGTKREGGGLVPRVLVPWNPSNLQDSPQL